MSCFSPHNFTFAEIDEGIIKVVVFVVIAIIGGIGALIKKIREVTTGNQEEVSRQRLADAMASGRQVASSPTSQRHYEVEQARLAAVKVQERMGTALPDRTALDQATLAANRLRMMGQTAPLPAARQPRTPGGNVRAAARTAQPAVPLPPAPPGREPRSAVRSSVQQSVSDDTIPTVEVHSPAPGVALLKALQRPNVLQQQFVTMEILGTPVSMRTPGDLQR